jgi:hypothetical protein
VIKASHLRRCPVAAGPNAAYRGFCRNSLVRRTPQSINRTAVTVTPDRFIRRRAAACVPLIAQIAE